MVVFYMRDKARDCYMGVITVEGPYLQARNLVKCLPHIKQPWPPGTELALCVHTWELSLGSHLCLSSS